MESPASLPTLISEQMEAARAASSGRSAVRVAGGQDSRMRAVLVTLCEGAALAEHENPGEAMLQVISGSVRLKTPDGQSELQAGDLLQLPQSRHSVTAMADSAFLLQVIPREHLASQS